MTQRNNKNIEDFIEDIDRKWNLSLVEEELLDSILNLILAGKTKEVGSVQHLLNDDTEELLQTLDTWDVTRYAEKYLGMVHETDIEAEKTLADFGNFEIEREYNMRELGEEVIVEHDVVTQMQLEELVSNFLSADFEKRNKMLEL